MQRGYRTRGRLRIHFCAFLEKQLRHVRVTFPAGNVQRRIGSNARHSFGACSRIEKHLGQFRIAANRGPMQCGHAIWQSSIHVRALFEQRTNGFLVSLHGCIGYSRIGRSRGDDRCNAQSSDDESCGQWFMLPPSCAFGVARGRRKRKRTGAIAKRLHVVESKHVQ